MEGPRSEEPLPPSSPRRVRFPSLRRIGEESLRKTPPPLSEEERKNQAARYSKDPQEAFEAGYVLGQWETARAFARTSGRLLCSCCGVNYATCIGAYETPTPVLPACDDCCGHGNEDGRCESIAELRGEEDEEPAGLEAEELAPFSSEIRRILDVVESELSIDVAYVSQGMRLRDFPSRPIPESFWTRIQKEFELVPGRDETVLDFAKRIRFRNN